MVADLVDGIMGKGRIDIAHMVAKHPAFGQQINSTPQDLQSKFPDVVEIDESALWLKQEAVALSRIVAAHLDGGLSPEQFHRSAV